MISPRPQKFHLYFNSSSSYEFCPRTVIFSPAHDCILRKATGWFWVSEVISFVKLDKSSWLFLQFVCAWTKRRRSEPQREEWMLREQTYFVYFRYWRSLNWFWVSWKMPSVVTGVQLRVSYKFQPRILAVNKQTLKHVAIVAIGKLTTSLFWVWIKGYPVTIKSSLKLEKKEVIYFWFNPFSRSSSNCILRAVHS